MRIALVLVSLHDGRLKFRSFMCILLCWSKSGDFGAFDLYRLSCFCLKWELKRWNSLVSWLLMFCCSFFLFFYLFFFYFKLLIADMTLFFHK